MLRKMWILLVIVALSVSLAACGGAEESSEPTAEPVATSAPAGGEADEEPDADENAAEESASAEGLRTFVVIPAESQASYIVQEEFLAGALTKLGINAGNYEVTGTTPGVEGQLALALENAAVGEGSRITVDMTGLTTGENRRDEWIQDNGPTFSEYPTAEFVPDAIENAPDAYSEGEETTFQLLGDLTVRDVTQPVTFDVTATLDGDTIRGTATANLLISDFGIEPPNFANTLTVSDEFVIRIELTAQEQ